MTTTSTAKMPEAMPHGDLTEVFPNTFFVTGTSRPTFMDQQWQFSRNMTVLRDASGDLTLVNTVRLDDRGLKALDALGTVRHVVRLGAFHGMDDAFYLQRYEGARLWALADMTHDHAHTASLLTEGAGAHGDLPFASARLFGFETSLQPEGLLVVDREGGILISCDSLQNWVEPDAYFNAESSEKLRQYGFIQPANIGPGWRGACKPANSDFAKLKALSFRHLLPAHGRPIVNDAHTQLASTFARDLGLT